METRFGALNFLCKLQILIGVLVILGGIAFLLFALAASNQPGEPPAPELAGWLAFAITVSLIFAGLQIIAMAQVYQCLMQIEINTRPEQALPAIPLPAASPLQLDAKRPCPRCNSGPTEIYERSREGEGWICRACNHTWLVSA